MNERGAWNEAPGRKYSAQGEMTWPERALHRNQSDTENNRNIKKRGNVKIQVVFWKNIQEFKKPYSNSRC